LTQTNAPISKIWSVKEFVEKSLFDFNVILNGSPQDKIKFHEKLEPFDIYSTSLKIPS